MLGALIPAAIGGAAAIGSGIMGSNAQKEAAARQAALAKEAADRFYNFEDPNYEAMQLKLEELKLQGLLTPELEQAILQDPSMMGQVSKDPRLAKAEMDALQTLASISSEGGLDPQAMLAIREAQMGGQAQARGARDANLQNAQARGVAGSGLEFVSNQLADQNAANQAELLGLQQAGIANDRDMEALQQYASMANLMGQQDIGLQSAKAQAEDARNKFNTTLRGDVQQRNVGAINTLNAANLGEKQRIADQNTLIRNQQQQYNKALPQQKFDNSLARAQGAAGLVPSQVGAAQAQGQAASNLWAGIGQGASGAASAIGNYYAGQERDDKLLRALASK